MKSIRHFLSAAVALLLLTSMLFACQMVPTEDNGNGTENGSPTMPELSTLKINGVALNDYTVVYNKTNISGGEEAYFYLNKKIDELYGVTLTKSSAIKDRYEILIALDGGDATVAAEYEESPDGFIGVSGKKIFLMGVNYGSLCGVIDFFLAKAQGIGTNKEITMTESEKVNVKKDSIKVLSYNVQQDLDKAGRRDDCLSEMVTTIRAEDPDVFGTQEDTKTINSGLMKGLPEYSCYEGAQYYDSPNSIRDYVYWKTDRFTVVGKGYQFMSDTPNVRSKYAGSNAYRGFTYLLLKSNETGNRFLFVNLHADYHGEESVRVAQLKVLTAFLKQINGDNIPMVILGDFNTIATKSGITTFEADNPRLGMTSKVAKTKGDTGSTLAIAEFTRRDVYVFDYIFVTTDKIYTKYYTAVDNIKDGKYPSDHLPVVAHIDIY